jgi:hypothetical protein
VLTVWGLCPELQQRSDLLQAIWIDVTDSQERIYRADRNPARRIFMAGTALK